MDTRPTLSGAAPRVDAGPQPHDGGGDDDDAGDEDAGLDGGLDADVPEPTLLDAPGAQELGTLSLDEAIVAVVHAGGLSFGLHAGSGVSLLDFADPSAPRELSFLATSSRAVAVHYDAARHIALVLGINGQLRAYRVVNPSAPRRIAERQLPSPQPSGAIYTDLTRVGDRLFALGGRSLHSVALDLAVDGSLAMSLAGTITVAAGAQRIAAGGSGLLVAFEGGLVQTFTAVDEPVRVEEIELGADILGWNVRGRRVVVALRDTGVRLVELRAGAPVEVLVDLPSLSDVASLEAAGPLVLVGLERGVVLALDLSSPAQPRSLARRDGVLPAWTAAIDGALVLGTARNVTVLGLPPFVGASVPASVRAALPSYAPIPLRLSKPVVASSVTIESVIVRCNGRGTPQSPLLSQDGTLLTLVPGSQLPADADCTIELSGVTDAQGLELTGATELLEFHVAAQSRTSSMHTPSSYPHTADGRFTDWTASGEDDYEYFDARAVSGSYGNLHVDYDGTRLWLLSDWFHGDSPIDPNCHHAFGIWTEGGMHRWDVRVYPDDRVEARLDGVRVPADSTDAQGGCSFGATPGSSTPHMVCELAIVAAEGNIIVELHGGGPLGSCGELESSPILFAGEVAGNNVLTAQVVPAQFPPAPSTLRPTGDVSTTVPTLRWRGTQALLSGSTYHVAIATAGDDGDVLFQTTAYGPFLDVPVGLLQADTSYEYRVAAFNIIGRSPLASQEMTVISGDAVAAPALSSVSPTRVQQNAEATLTLSGQGFIPSAVVVFGDSELSSSFESSSALSASLPASLTASAGVVSVSVRNLSGELGTQSNAVSFEVIAPCAHGECLPGAALADGCSDCASAVCAQNATCCGDLWGGACVELAAVNAGCTCTPPALGQPPLTPDMGTAGDVIPVSVSLLNGASGPTYALALTLSGTETETLLACTYVAADAACTASIPASLAPGTYDAAVRVTSATASYDTISAANAFVLLAP